jgi:hypothetical protein
MTILRMKKQVFVLRKPATEMSRAGATVDQPSTCAIVRRALILQEVYMNRSIVAASVIACAFACALAAQAQQAAPKEHSMTGCLKKSTEANSYLVTDVQGNGPKSIGIVSSTVNLAPHVGHKIEVTGTTVPVTDAEALQPAPPKAPHYMKLTAIKMLSTTCP